MSNQIEALTLSIQVDREQRAKRKVQLLECGFKLINATKHTFDEALSAVGLSEQEYVSALFITLALNAVIDLIEKELEND